MNFFARLIDLGSLVLLLFVGLLPSFVFFIWIERNASLPWVAIELGWPWWDLRLQPTALLCVWNVGLFLLFGAMHSGLAQIKTPRKAFMILTGLSVIAVMGLWQNTGLVVYALPLSQNTAYAVSMSLYWIFAGASAWVLSSHGVTDFIGVTKAPETIGQLQTTGLYRWIRHPAYTLTLLAFFLTPVMTLDRFLIALTALLYLWLAIPYEEKKLHAKFGPAYETYRKSVPALFPRLGKKKSLHAKKFPASV